MAMGSRERIRTIIGGEAADRVGFWLGNPHGDTWPILHRYFGTSATEQLLRLLKDDLRWIRPGAYRHPEGKPMWDMQRAGRELSAGGVFADCEDVEQVHAHEWPDPDYLDFDETLQRLRVAGDVYRPSGFWCPFFHEVADFLGMENYFVKMHTHPEVVHAITRHIIDFYLEANRRFYEVAGDLIDAFFFGNDFGTQRGLLVRPEMMRNFIFPYFRQLTDLAHDHGYQVILHSCGSVYDVIPDLLDMGVEALHPLQARAANMEAERLAAELKGKVAFVGGVDTQDLLVNGSPRDVIEDVERLKDLLGPCLIVSPSHEAILPNVPPENIEAMADAAVGE
ncbi:uroporphyrinogen decarboxylase family protein [Candidatus Latescibacterota bacterium]